MRDPQNFQSSMLEDFAIRVFETLGRSGLELQGAAILGTNFYSCEGHSPGTWAGIVSHFFPHSPVTADSRMIAMAGASSEGDNRSEGGEEELTNSQELSGNTGRLTYDLNLWIRQHRDVQRIEEGHNTKGVSVEAEGGHMPGFMRMSMRRGQQIG